MQTDPRYIYHKTKLIDITATYKTSQTEQRWNTSLFICYFLVRSSLITFVIYEDSNDVCWCEYDLGINT